VEQVAIFLLLSLPLVGAFAMLGLGIAVTYQASRVLNIAHGAMAMVPAFVLFELTERGVPVAVGLVIAVASGSLLGVATERVFVRGLRRQGPTGQTVGTVAALSLLVAVSLKIWGSTPRTAVRLFPDGGIDVGASLLRYGQIGLFAVALVAAGAFFVLFKRTSIGLSLRGVADNRVAAGLCGVDPEAITRLAWAIGGGFAALAGILLAAVTVLHPVNLSLLVLPAFVAALIGGLSSVKGTLAGAAVVGIVQGMVPAIGLIPGIGSFATQVGAPQLVLAILALVVMALRGAKLSAAEQGGGGPVAATPASRPVLRGSRTLPRRILGGVLAAGLLAWPFGAPFSLLTDAVNAAIIVVIAVSLVLLTGWVGQISLAHAAFVGVGAFSTGLLTRRVGVPFPLNLPLAAAITAGVAVALGLVALRVRGLYLAVATLIFGWMATEYLFSSSWFVGVGGSASIEAQTIGSPETFPYFDLTEPRTFYFVALAIAAAALWGAANLRDSKTGRAFYAVRGSEVAAASLGIDVMRTKLMAFALSGALAGAAGNMLIVSQGAASPAQFTFSVSLLYLSVVVVGGLTSLGGAVAASILFAALNQLFFRVRGLAGWLEIVSAGLLAVVLLAYPGGLANLARAIGARWRAASENVSWFRRAKKAEAQPEDAPAVRPVLAPVVAGGANGTLALSVRDVTVQFGGLIAVEDASLSVGRGRIVGLIGPNGAGKTTLFNAISGLVTPQAGTVEVFGTDVTAFPVHRRSAAGLGRTFQIVQLFAQLSVFDNLLVATHLQNRTGMLGHLVVTRPAFTAEQEAIERVRSVIALLDLEDVARRSIGELPFGVLRTVELARAVVSGASVLMLDEPASGLDNAETDELTERLFRLRDDLGLSILLIEHDVRMVMRASEYVYVLDRGRIIAEGDSGSVRRDPAVVAAYLGQTSEAGRASGA